MTFSHHRARLTLACAACLSAAGCSDVPNTFEVTDCDGAVAIARLKLCGREQNLSRAGDRFSGKQGISCEGDGRITLSFRNRTLTDCIVGYVTPGMVQRFRYVVKSGLCRGIV